ncbi:MAG: hypothetical protein LW806_01815 [Planctomycetaceae bacterium]|jgi:hypothetical protein|nr:hypothetical protein [Planctomycetaceae bacterium]
MRIRGLVLSTLLPALMATMLSGCGGSPWEQGMSDEAAAVAADREVTRVFYADKASLDVWNDERPSGSIIRHGKLVVREPRLPSRDEPRGGRIEVISSGPELQTKVADIVADRIPVAAGMKTNFALGRAVPVRVERVDAKGARTVLAEGRVAFLELTR